MSLAIKSSEQLKQQLGQLEIYLKGKNVKIFNYSQFEDLEQIGEGGCGIVYSANFQGVRYALKSLRKNLQLTKEEIKEFKRELENFYKIEEHPNIIKFYGISRDVNDFMFVLQFANGGNLRNYLFGKQKDDERPSMDEILKTLNGLSKTTTNFNVENTIDKVLNLSVKLLECFVNLTDNGTEFIQISKSINEIIDKYQETSQTIFKYICENQNDDLKYICLLGFFYLMGVGTREDHETSFNTFEKAAKEVIIAKFYLGECFRCGYGTEKDPIKAISCSNSCVS
ncbi:26107_t:CDS:2 [Dentiscutata erythropus]|uniref:26107_t:CDS:1 n=1 Tax=Dentiscutata erythropus TaxID=1348616 RepID=A0A9N9H222_9GLOM|nr:26107_t:CDS:2 [Dentiscutata erythropus]